MIKRRIYYESDLPKSGLTADEIRDMAQSWLRSVDWITYPIQPDKERFFVIIGSVVGFAIVVWFLFVTIFAVSVGAEGSVLDALLGIVLAFAVPVVAFAVLWPTRRNREMIARFLIFDGTDFAMFHSGLGAPASREQLGDPAFIKEFPETVVYVEEWRVPATMPIRVQFAPTDGRVPGRLHDVFFQHEGFRYVFSRSGITTRGFAESLDSMANWQFQVEAFIREHTLAVKDGPLVSASPRPEFRGVPR